MLLPPGKLLAGNTAAPPHTAPCQRRPVPDSDMPLSGAHAERHPGHTTGSSEPHRLFSRIGRTRSPPSKLPRYSPRRPSRGTACLPDLRTGPNPNTSGQQCCNRHSRYKSAPAARPPWHHRRYNKPSDSILPHIDEPSRILHFEWRVATVSSLPPPLLLPALIAASTCCNNSRPGHPDHSGRQ